MGVPFPSSPRASRVSERLPARDDAARFASRARRFPPSVATRDFFLVVLKLALISVFARSFDGGARLVDSLLPRASTRSIPRSTFVAHSLSIARRATTDASPRTRRRRLRRTPLHISWDLRTHRATFFLKPAGFTQTEVAAALQHSSSAYPLGCHISR